MNNIEDIVKKTIVDMIKNGDLQIEVTFDEIGCDKYLVTDIYYFSDDMKVRELIQSNKSRI